MVDRIEVGDYIQWECRGLRMFKPLAKVTDFSPCRRYCFVEGSRCGIPVKEVVEVQKGTLKTWKEYRGVQRESEEDRTKSGP